MKNRNLDILGYGFSVTVQPMEVDQAGESDACGLSIKINEALPPSVQAETFYHEVSHMLLDLGGYSHLLGKRQSEALSQYLGMALLQLISKNPSLPTLEEEK